MLCTILCVLFALLVVYLQLYGLLFRRLWRLNRKLRSRGWLLLALGFTVGFGFILWGLLDFIYRLATADPNLHLEDLLIWSVLWRVLRGFVGGFVMVILQVLGFKEIDKELERVGVK